jgi:hypothetical protein
MNLRRGDRVITLKGQTFVPRGEHGTVELITPSALMVRVLLDDGLDGQWLLVKYLQKVMVLDEIVAALDNES